MILLKVSVGPRLRNSEIEENKAITNTNFLKNKRP